MYLAGSRQHYIIIIYAIPSKNELALSSCDLLLKEAVSSEVLTHLEHLKMDLLPGNAELTAAEIELTRANRTERRLAEGLKNCRDQYD
ncbi:MAG: ParA family protein [Methylococcales bacterium]